jgi:hypothetical protein
MSPWLIPLFVLGGWLLRGFVDLKATKLLLARAKPWIPSPQSAPTRMFDDTDLAQMRIARIKELAGRQRTPIFRLGERVLHRKQMGRVDAVYADLAAASDALVIPYDWLSRQVEKPITAPDATWYNVVLEDGGATLAGEDDLIGPVSEMSAYSEMQ